MNELDEVEGLIKEAVMSLDKAVKSVVECKGHFKSLEDIQKTKYWKR